MSPEFCPQRRVSAPDSAGQLCLITRMLVSIPREQKSPQPRAFSCVSDAA
jgi:hypothetical protein